MFLAMVSTSVYLDTKAIRDKISGMGEFSPIPEFAHS